MTEQAAIQVAWTETAPRYDEYVTPPNMAFAEGTTEWAALRPDIQVWDVAAGSGGLSSPAARAGAQVQATDISPAVIERLEGGARAALDDELRDRFGRGGPAVPNNTINIGIGVN